MPRKHKSPNSWDCRRADIEEMILVGASLREIGVAYPQPNGKPTTRERIRQVLMRWGIELRGADFRVDLRRDSVRNLHADGKSCKEIAAAVGMHIATVSDDLAALGLLPNDPHAVVRDTIFRMRSAGASYKEICAETGLKPHALCARLQRYGLTRKPEKRMTPGWWTLARVEELKELIRSGMTPAEAAVVMGVATNAVTSTLQRFGIRISELRPIIIGRNGSRSCHPWPAARRRPRVLELHEQGLFPAAIVDAFSGEVGFTTVVRDLTALGLTPHNGRLTPRRRKRAA